MGVVQRSLIDIAFDLRNKSDYRDFVAPDEVRVKELLRELCITSLPVIARHMCAVAISLIINAL